MTIKSGLILMAHGSRNSTANQEFVALTESVAEKYRGLNQSQTNNVVVTCVLPAFLELASPTLAQAAEVAASKNVSHINVYPLFFNSGRHVGKDIPMQVAEIMDRYPKIEINLLSYFGRLPSLAQIIAEDIIQQGKLL